MCIACKKCTYSWSLSTSPRFQVKKASSPADKWSNVHSHQICWDCCSAEEDENITWCRPIPNKNTASPLFPQLVMKMLVVYFLSTISALIIFFASQCRFWLHEGRFAMRIYDARLHQWQPISWWIPWEFPLFAIFCFHIPTCLILAPNTYIKNICDCKRPYSIIHNYYSIFLCNNCFMKFSTVLGRMLHFRIF